MIDEERPPARVEHYIRALGQDGAVAFLMKFGGETISIPTSAERKCKLARQIGTEQVVAMLHVFGAGRLKVPQCKRWVAHRMDAAGVPRPEIGRRLRVTQETVRLYFVDRKPRPESRA